MKKLLSVLICIFMYGINAYALSSSDLKFEKDMSGKYIYCNNPEFIYRENLADISNENPSYLMNNENLGADDYTIFLSHINHTEIGDGTRWGVVAPGFDIEVDVVFIAKEDSVVTIDRAGFEVPENYKYYMNGNTYTNEEAWGCFNAWASYMGTEISEIDSGKKYYPVPFEPVTLDIKKGERVWLGQFIKNYSAVPFYRPVHLIADFEIESGILDVNVAALKSTGTLNNRSNFSEKSKFGSYIFEHQHKGISNNKNIVNAELNFIIDDKTQNQTLLPVKVYNQYAPEGCEVQIWYTNLNPRSDPWNKFNVAETCMVEFQYKDPEKLKYYGKKALEKDDIWRFDNFHSDRIEYTEKASGYTKFNFVPNYVLEQGNKEEYAASLGNFGVFQNYKITIQNDGLRDRFVNYKLNTGSDNLIILRDENGNLIENYPVTKGHAVVKEKDILACVKLPAKKTTTFYLTVVLTTNYAGGMENCLEITDDAKPVKVYNSNFSKNVKDFNFTGKEFIKWEDGDILVSDDLKEWKKISLNDETKKIFKGNYSNFRIIYTGNGYIAKPCIYDGVTYYTVKDFYKNIYLLDNNFNLVKTKEFDEYVKDISYGNGIYYAEAGTKYYSHDFEKWEMADNTFDIPLNNYSKLTASMKNGIIYLSENGIDFKKVVYENINPEYIDSLGNLYYYIDNNKVYYSADGVYWDSFKVDENIFSISKTEDKIIINKTKEYDFNYRENEILCFNNEFIGLKNPLIKNSDGVMMISARSAAKLIGADILWKDGEVLISSDMRFKPGEDLSFIIDGACYIPLRFFFEKCGFTVDYNEGIVYVK